MTRKPLGRGLGALLSAEPSVGSVESIEIDEALIEPCSVQPRSRFNNASLIELAESIKANGVVQPILVRRKAGRFELIAGERRLRAARIAGLRTVPALVREVPDEKLLEIALVENIQREDLNAIEEAQAYKGLLENVGLTQEALASRIGRDRSYVTNYLRLLRLPSDVQTLVQDGALSTGHARALLGLSEPKRQRELAAAVVRKGLTVRETERLIKRAGEESGQRTTRHSAARSIDPNVKALETKLRRELGTQVALTQKPGTDEGVLQIRYFNLTDLNRITQRILSGPAVSSTAQF
jgi:ParB family chromosome partitioning protein